MAKYSEQQINNIYLRCNAVPMEQLLQLCLDPDSGISIEGLRAVHYNKIDLLEQRYNAQAEEIIWARSQDTVEALTQYIGKCKKGLFSNAHLQEAMNRLKQLAAEAEEKEWLEVEASNDAERLTDFINRCKDGIYSDSHLSEAQAALEWLDWNAARQSQNVAQMNAYVQKCKMGVYSVNHLEEASAMLEKWANGSIAKEWEAITVLRDTDPQKLSLLNAFIQKYAGNQTETAQKYMAQTDQLMKALIVADEARKDWIDARNENTILGYVKFLSRYPYCEYREEAEHLVQEMKGSLLSDMKLYPFKYNRERMYEYISTNALTMEELVDKSNTLTDRGYSHIKRYPRLIDEQRELPLSRLENPQSQEGNTDVIFFGVTGSGKTCALAGLMSLTGRLGFRFDPKGPGGGGSYAMELRNYARTSMLPPSTQNNYVQVIDAQIDDERGRLHKISLIEMSGEKTAEFASMENPTDFNDLGPGAAGLMSNNNNKVIFFVIDPTNEKEIQLKQNQFLKISQSDVLNCVSSLLAKNPSFMRKVVAIHIILTKSDTLGDYVDEETVQDLLNRQGYQAVLADIKSLCEKYQVNQPTGFKVGLYPFCVGKFMPGEVYTFDETDSLKILRVIQKNTVPMRKRGFMDAVADWFNS